MKILVSNSKKRRNLLRRNDGAVYVIALVTLIVGATLSLALLRAAGGQFLMESSGMKKQAAANLADAGIDYASWQVITKKQSLPYSADVDLDTGRFHVDAVDDGARQTGAVLITSTGITGDFRYTTKRVIGNTNEH